MKLKNAQNLRHAENIFQSVEKRRTFILDTSQNHGD